MILVDAHVHIYDCFNLDQFFDAALSNFRKEANRHGHQEHSAFFLLLSEGSQYNWFQRLAAFASGGRQSQGNPLGKWTVDHTGEDICLMAQRRDSPDDRIFVVAGRQIVTSEKLEVLSLFSDSGAEDGASLESTVDHIIEGDGIPVIPWGAGKWFGKRGRILKGFLRSNTEKDLFISDTGSRPKIWPTPLLVRHAQAKGFRILRGSDPLPLPSDMSRVGNFGAYLHCNCTDYNPAACLKKMLKDRGQKHHIGFYGELQRTFPFLVKQLTIALRLGSLSDL